MGQLNFVKIFAGNELLEKKNARLTKERTYLSSKLNSNQKSQQEQASDAPRRKRSEVQRDLFPPDTGVVGGAEGPAPVTRHAPHGRM